MAYAFFAFFLPMKKGSLTVMMHNKRRGNLSEPLIREARLDGSFHVHVPKTGPGVIRYLILMITLARSAVIILDGHCTYLNGVRPRKGALVVQAWHAGGLFKKFGLDLYPNADKKTKARLLREHSSYSWVLTSAPALDTAYARAFGVQPEKVRALGLISTDRLYEARREYADLRARLDAAFPHIAGKKLVLYAPTFRNEDNEALRRNPPAPIRPRINAIRFETRLAPHYVPVFRAHYYIRGGYELDAPWLDASFWPLHEALSLADVLITDYSSIFFDFLLFRRPVLFFPYDLEEYTAKRGFYAPYETFVPGPVFRKQDELFTHLEQLATHDNAFHREHAEFWARYMGACDGVVGKKVFRFLKEQMKIASD